MGRPKRYSDEVLLAQAEVFWNQVCRSDPAKFTYKAFSEYLVDTAGTYVPPDTLKHNRTLHARIDALRNGILLKTIPQPTSDPDTKEARILLQELASENEKLKSFIIRSYVHDICCQLINEELHIRLQSLLNPEAVRASVITAGMKPFRSPVLNELSSLFDIDEEQTNEPDSK